MSNTPRTDNAIAAMREINADPFYVESSFCKRIERELTAANARISALEAHVKRMEEAGDAMFGVLEMYGEKVRREWTEAKEAKP